MKTIEEKAKAYDEALERANQIRNGNPSSGTAIVVCEQIFPELRESESEDERIRKWIVTFIEVRLPDAAEFEPQYRAALAYLEKQKELLTPEEKMNHPLYLEGFDVGRKVGQVEAEQKPISDMDIVPYIDDKIAELQDLWREQKVAFDWDDVKDMIEDVARHFYQKEQKPVEWSEEDVYFANRIVDAVIFGAQWQRVKSEKPTTAEGLYDFMKNRSESLYFHDDFEIAAYKKGVVDGAKWQKEKDNEVADKALTTSIKLQEGWYAKGIADGEKSMKEQMMRSAVEGWVARDGFDNTLCFFSNKPHRPDIQEPLKVWKMWLGGCFHLPKQLFPDLEWEDEPKKVKLIIIKEDKK